MKMRLFLFLSFTAVTLAAYGSGDQSEKIAYPVGTMSPKVESSSVAGSESRVHNSPQAPFWGDTHVHSSYSFDVFYLCCPMPLLILRTGSPKEKELKAQPLDKLGSSPSHWIF